MKGRITQITAATTAHDQSPTEPSQPLDEAPLTWSVTEPRSRQRWWWYGLVGFLGIAFSIALFGLGNWSAALTALAAALALIVIAASRPRAWKHILTGSTMQIRTTRKPIVSKTIELERFRAFTVLESDNVHKVLLLPKSRVEPAFHLWLPRNDETSAAVLDRLGERVPYDPAEGVQMQERSLDAMARWTGLDE